MSMWLCNSFSADQLVLPLEHIPVLATLHMIRLYISLCLHRLLSVSLQASATLCCFCCYGCVLQGKHKGNRAKHFRSVFSLIFDCFTFLSWEDNAVMGCRNNIKLVDVHMGFVFPTAPAHLRNMLPSVAWPPVTEPGSDKIVAPSRCDGNAKHTKQPCLNDKAGKHRKPAMAESLDSASSISSDMPPFLQPATSESGATVESGENMSHECDNDPSKSTYKEPPTDTEPTPLKMQHPTTPAVHHNTKTAATRSPDSTFTTTRSGGSKPVKGAEACKSHNPSKILSDQLPSGLPPTATAPTEPTAVKPPAATHHVAAGVDEHVDNPLADCSITKSTKSATPMAARQSAGTTVTAQQGQPVTAVEDASWLDDLEKTCHQTPYRASCNSCQTILH